MLEEVGSKGNVTLFKYGNKFIKVTIGDLESTIDADAITKIDMNNLIGEIITTPVLVNRWGNIQADIAYQLQVENLEFDIWSAQTKESIRAELNQTKKATVAEVDDALVSNPLFKEKKLKIFKLEKTFDIVKSVYWSLKDKSDKLNKLSLTLQKDDLIVVKNMVVNGIKIVIKKPRDEED